MGWVKLITSCLLLAGVTSAIQIEKAEDEQTEEKYKENKPEAVDTKE